MNINGTIKKLAAVMLLAGMALSLICCGTQSGAPGGVNGNGGPKLGSVNLMEGITAKLGSSPVSPSKEGTEKAADFALRLFKACAAGRNESMLISPLSVLYALSMTANGAGGNTLAQMEQVLGMSNDELNEFCRNYSAQLPSGEKNKLELANSIWFTNEEWFKVNESFLQTNADYYGADIYKTPFDDASLKDINNWVKEKTDGMIPSIVDKFPDNITMYLINALAFDAEWEDVYKKSAVLSGEFTLEDGTKKNVTMMYSTESDYLSGDNFTGLIKYYKGGKYAFAALLPNEGVKVSELISSLDGGALTAALASPETTEVNAAIPKFEMEYSDELSEVLMRMGMTDAFESGSADFSRIGEASVDGNTRISRVLHKTYIQVDEKGTKAGAVTAVEMPTDGAMPVETKTVHLDRPFVYMLIDCETNLPFFIGTMMDPGK